MSDKSNRIPFRYKGKTHQIAQHWDTLSTTEYLKIVNCLFSSMKLNLTPTETKILLAEILCNQPPYEFVNLKNIVNEDDEDGQKIYDGIMLELLKLTDFIISFDEEAEKYSIVYKRFTLYKEIKEIKHGTTTWLAPKDDLSVLTFWEWTRCCMQYEAYCKHNNANEIDAAEAALDVLLAILWRPRGLIVVGSTEDVRDHRQPFYNHEMQAMDRANTWRDGRHESPTEQYLIRQAILFWFQSVRQRIIDQYPFAFQQGGGGIERNYAEVLVAIAGGYDTSSLAKTGLHNVLTQLSLDGKRAAEAKDRIPNV